MKKTFFILGALGVITLFFWSMKDGMFANANSDYTLQVKPNKSTVIKVVQGKQTPYELVLPNKVPEKWEGTLEADANLGLSGELLEELNQEIVILKETTEKEKDIIKFETTQKELEIAITATKPDEMSLIMSYETNTGIEKFDITVEPLAYSLLAERVTEDNGLESIPSIPEKALPIDLLDYFGIVGDASVPDDYRNTLVPIPDATYQKGAMWSRNRINLRKDFSMEMFMYLYEEDASNFGDGITITFQNDERSIEAIGSSGAGIGAYPIESPNGKEKDELYIKNAISVEFDPWSNFSFDDDYDNYPGLKTKPHIAVTRPMDRDGMKTKESRSHAKFAAPITDINFNQPKWNVVTAYWTTENETLRVGYEELQSDGSYQEVASIVAKLSNYEELFDGPYVHWGMTGSTGGAKGAYYTAMKKMPEIDLGDPTTDVINKTKNEKFGKTGDNNQTTADNGDRLEYRLTHEVDGNQAMAFLKEYRIHDELPKGITYKKGTTTYSHKNTDTGKLISKGEVPDSCWQDDELIFTVPEDVREDSEIIVHYEAEFSSSTYKKEKLVNSWTYTTANGYTQYSTDATVIKEREKYEITERYLDTDSNSVIQKETNSLVDINKEGETLFKREPLLIEGYELEKYVYETKDKSEEVILSNDEIVKFPLTDDTTITYYYKVANYSPRIQLKTKNNELVVHYRNVDQLDIKINNETYKILDVPQVMNDESLAIPIRINSDRTKVSVQGKIAGEVVTTATLNSQK